MLGQDEVAAEIPERAARGGPRQRQARDPQGAAPREEGGGHLSGEALGLGGRIPGLGRDAGRALWPRLPRPRKGRAGFGAFDAAGAKAQGNLGQGKRPEIRTSAQTLWPSDVI